MRTDLFDQDGVQIYQTPEEVQNLKDILTKIPAGDLIEVGVFMGATTKVLAKTFPDRTIYAYDTFEGFPDNINVAKGDDQRYKVGDMKEATLEVVQENLKNCPNVELIKGTFPESGNSIKSKKFAFAHIDVDTYESTKDTLQFIWQRMLPGGLVLIHDYPAHNGVKQAVDELGFKGEILGARQLLIQHD
jgi:O-methyltransferase